MRRAAKAQWYWFGAVSLFVSAVVRDLRDALTGAGGFGVVVISAGRGGAVYGRVLLEEGRGPFVVAVSGPSVNGGPQLVLSVGDWGSPSVAVSSVRAVKCVLSPAHYRESRGINLGVGREPWRADMNDAEDDRPLYAKARHACAVFLASQIFVSGARHGGPPMGRCKVEILSGGDLAGAIVQD